MAWQLYTIQGIIMRVYTIVACLIILSNCQLLPPKSHMPKMDQAGKSTQLRCRSGRVTLYTATADMHPHGTEGSGAVLHAMGTRCGMMSIPFCLSISTILCSLLPGGKMKSRKSFLISSYVMQLIDVFEPETQFILAIFNLTLIDRDKRFPNS